MIVVDAGPIVALLNRRDSHHAWARDVMRGLPTPLVTCEAVVAEACHLLRAHGGDLVMDLGARGFLSVSFALREHWSNVRALMQRYANVPMSLADACLVRMSEVEPAARVLTLDGDFHVYRRNGRHAIPVISP